MNLTTEDFRSVLDSAWLKHDSAQSKTRLLIESAFELQKTDKESVDLARLVSHFYGEHLFEIEAGSMLLSRIKEASTTSTYEDLDFYLTVFEILKNPEKKDESILNLKPDTASRVLMYCSLPLLIHRGSICAEAFWKHSLSIAEALESDLNMSSAKLIASTSNGIACYLEEKNELMGVDSMLLEQSALIARKYWEIAGSSLQIERAEYRISKSSLKLGKLDQALLAAQKCLKIVQKDRLGPFEEFFAIEAILAVKRRMDSAPEFQSEVVLQQKLFNELGPADQAYCKQYLISL